MIAGFKGEYRWLSNFWACSVCYDGLWYPSSENLYQALKFPEEDRVLFSRISAAEAKRKARLLKPEITDEERILNMELVSMHKYLQNIDLAMKLIDTGDEDLIERNDWGDRFFGVDEKGTGENYLGRILMKTRQIMRIYHNQNI